MTAKRNRYLWLIVGAGLSLFAVQGRWDIALAAWLFGVFVLRYTRTSRVVPGMLGAWAAGSAALVFWLYESGMPIFSPVLPLVFALSAVMTLPYLADRLLSPRLGVLAATLVFPLARVACEFLVMGVGPTGGIVGSLGATQVADRPLLQLAAVTGTYGISFLVAWFAAVANAAWEHGLTRRTLAPVVAFAVVLGLTVTGGAAYLAFFPPGGRSVRIAGVSPTAGGMAQVAGMLERYPRAADLAAADPAALRGTFARVNDELIAATRRQAGAGAKIVVWPEIGAWAFEQDTGALLARVGALAAEAKVYVLIGMEVVTHRPAVRNQAVLVAPTGKVLWTYDKTHPIAGMEEYAPGDGHLPITDTPYGRLVTALCYDADFPGLLRQGGRAGADILLLPSNDWREFGAAHSRLAVLRAVENGYSLVRQDVEGRAETADYQGRVLAASDYFMTDQQVMVADVPVRGARTLYARFGDLFAGLCVAGLTTLTGVAAVRRRRAKVPQAPAEVG